MAAAHIAHPHVAAATDFGKLEDGSVFLVLEYVEGRSLAEIIEEGPVPFERALRLALQIASALEAAHALGIVHRDLKPDNILLASGEDGNDFVKVLDFGVAKVPAETSSSGKPITQVGMVYGTPEYMAPEQALGQDVDGRADLYALGVVTYELLAASRPYGGAAVGLLGQQLTKPLPLLSERAPGVKVPPRVEAFVRDLLVTDVQKRVPSAEVARAQIEELLADLEAGTLLRAGEKSRLSIGLGEVGQRIERVTQSIPQPIHRVVKSRRSRAAMLALIFGALGVVAAILAVGAFAQSGGAEHAVALSPPPAPVEIPLPEPNLGPLLEAAKQGGVAELQELAKKHPSWAQVHAELALAWAVAKDYPAAVDAARVALALDPKLNESPVIAGALFRAAQAPTASDSSFRLLKGVMGSAGADIIYDLHETPNVKPYVKKQAADFLASEEVKLVASPGLLLVLELAKAKDCAAVEPLVKKAAIVGDRRALPALHALEETSGCGASKAGDCHLCLRGKPDLELAIKTIEGRAPLAAPEEG